MGIGGSGGSTTQTTKTELPPEVAHFADQYLNMLGNWASGQFGALAPYSVPQLLQSTGLTQQETFGSSPYPMPRVGPGGQVQQFIPPGANAPISPAPPQGGAVPNPYLRFANGLAPPSAPGVPGGVV